jgi:hypothetical protein
VAVCCCAALCAASAKADCRLRWGAAVACWCIGPVLAALAAPGACWHQLAGLLSVFVCVVLTRVLCVPWLQGACHSCAVQASSNSSWSLVAACRMICAAPAANKQAHHVPAAQLPLCGHVLVVGTSPWIDTEAGCKACFCCARYLFLRGRVVLHVAARTACLHALHCSNQVPMGHGENSSRRSLLTALVHTPCVCAMCGAQEQEDSRALMRCSRRLPEGALPEGALLEGALPEGALPEGALPEGALPGALEGCGQQVVAGGLISSV